MAPKQVNYVAYYRVSTQKQGASGLGLEAQKASVKRFIDGHKLIAEFTEVESGKDNHRPQLQAALARCRMHRGSILVVAKLDRLSRNAAFLMTLKDAGVRFIAVDMPEANELVVGIMALMAQHERKMISERTKAALQAAKARGVKLGNPQNLLKGGTTETACKARKAYSEQANNRAKDVAGLIKQARDEGCSTLKSIAARLNDQGIPSPRGGVWYPTSVKNALDRLQ